MVPTYHEQCLLSEKRYDRARLKTAGSSCAVVNEARIVDTPHITVAGALREVRVMVEVRVVVEVRVMAEVGEKMAALSAQVKRMAAHNAMQ